MISCKIFRTRWVRSTGSAFLFLILIILLPPHDNGACLKENPVLAKKPFKIAIFREKDFPAIGTPGLLTPEWLYQVLSETYDVSYLDCARLNDEKYLNLGNADLLIMPYGEAFPLEAFNRIRAYLFEGGGLLNISGRPFWAPISRVDGKWQRSNIADPYKEFLSVLGIKYYEFPDNDDIGLTVTTSLGVNPVKPTHGNVFPYRVPVRDFYHYGEIQVTKGKAPVIFIKSWENPYMRGSDKMPKKWCLMGSRGEDNPLNPEEPVAENNLIRIIEYLSFPVLIHELQPELASYRQNEKVRISIKATNNANTEESCIVEFEFQDERGSPVHKRKRPVKLGPGRTITLNEAWNPKGFKGRYYKVQAVLKKNGLIMDKEENGFVILREDVLRLGPKIQVKDRGFRINGEDNLILGVNYYESKLGELMWLKPNIFRVREDFRSMKEMGINLVRIHYHHSKWFRDYFSRVVREDAPKYLKMADAAPLPSERSLRILDAFIQLAQEHDLVFCMDIFSLVPEEMGDPIGWSGLKERISDTDKFALQKKFIAILAARYKGVPGITWDLWNEPRLEEQDLELLRSWAREIKEEFRKNGDHHLITIGDDLSLSLLDVLDYACIHTYEPGEFKPAQDFLKPVIFQEVWNTAGCSQDEEKKQAQELNKDFNAFLESEAAGFMPWQWTRQARLWNNASDDERWDDELGLCVHDDGTLRLPGKTYSSLIRSLKNMAGEPK